MAVTNQDSPQTNNPRGGSATPLREILSKFAPQTISGAATNSGAANTSNAEPTYTCPRCHDAHVLYPRNADGTVDYSHLVPCICVKDKLDEERRQYLVSWCEMPEHAREMTIAKFVVRKGLEEAYRAAKDMAEAAPATAGWLTFQSPTNRGKTHLACAICNRWLERGVPARYAYVPALLDELRRGFRNGGDGTYDDRFQQFLSVPLLLLDDLGQENQTNWVQERLDAIVDYRLMHRLPLVVTTMYHMRELPASISSRLDRAGRIITIDAPGFSPPRH